VRKIGIKRIYDEPARTDGFRVLVDRVWPRGVSKKTAAVDYWAKDIAPSTALRKWFNHDPNKWTDFQRRYRSELEAHTAELRSLIERGEKSPMTLLFSAKDREHNQAVVIKSVLQKL
jgi:uncharacterized protein YeaO (DUF488 family)